MVLSEVQGLLSIFIAVNVILEDKTYLMSTELDISYIKEIYERMTDSELTYKITRDGRGISPEVQLVVTEEVERRGLDPQILRALNAQNKDYTTTEIDSYCEIIRDLHCPKCGGSQDRLNGSIVYEAMSFIIFTQYSRKILIACPSCLGKSSDTALIKTIILGWWGIPWGPIRTIQSIIKNVKGRKYHIMSEPNDYLRSFTAHKIGVIEVYKDNKEKLQQLITSID